MKEKCSAAEVYFQKIYEGSYYTESEARSFNFLQKSVELKVRYRIKSRFENKKFKIIQFVTSNFTSLAHCQITLA